MNKKRFKWHWQHALIIVTLFLTSGCGSSPKPDFYHLEQAVSTQLTGLERGTAIGIGPVNVAPYLDRPQIVTRSGDHKLELSEFNRWSEPLKVSISRVIAINVSNALQSNRVYLLPMRKQTIPLDYQVTIDIARFDGRLDDSAQLTARWSVYDQDDAALITKVSIISQAVAGPGYENLVAAENKTLQLLSDEISAAIISYRK